MRMLSYRKIAMGIAVVGADRLAGSSSQVKSSSQATTDFNVLVLTNAIPMSRTL